MKLFGASLVVMALLSAGASAQMAGPLQPMPQGRLRDQNSCNNGMALQFRGSAANGEIIDRTPHRETYALPTGLLYANIVRIDNLTTIEVYSFVSMPNVFALVVCHGTLILEKGQQVSGRFAIQLTDRGPVSSWWAD